MKGVAMLYRWSVTPDQQRQFVSQWRTTARELRRLGALGCHLLRSDSGEFVGLIRWPSEYARTRAGKAADTYPLAGISAPAEVQFTVEDDVSTAAPAPLALAL